MAGVYGGFTSSAEFIDGAQRDFIPFHIYAFLKTLIFAMLATIPSFHGYYMKVVL
jgi:phospholipid/cholesterol/gamma-HCH transport system permease protein